MKLDPWKFGSAAVGIAAALVALPLTGSAHPLLPVGAQAEQSVPQGNDSPGADDPDTPRPTPEKHQGVITPPLTGDEEIHTTVPNPDAGHDQEVLPPPGTPENAPNLDPR